MPLLLTDSTSAIYGQSCPVLNSYSSLKILPQSMTIKPWFAGMGSNHELDRILNSHNLLILKVAEVVKSIKSRELVQNRYKIFSEQSCENRGVSQNLLVNRRTTSAHSAKKPAPC
jgi:hypothetical protein